MAITKEDIISVAEQYWMDYPQEAEGVERTRPDCELFTDGFFAGVLHGMQLMKSIKRMAELNLEP